MSEADKNNEAVPVVYAYDDGHHYTMWCDFCRAWHRHGRGDGDVAAHCAYKDSPYRRTGYVLRCVGPLTNEVRAAHAAEEKKAKRVYRRWAARGWQDSGPWSWGALWETQPGSSGR